MGCAFEVGKNAGSVAIIVCLLGSVALVQSGGRSSILKEPADDPVDNLLLIDAYPELLATIDDSNFTEYPVAKESKLRKVEQLRSEIFEVGDLVKLDRKKVEKKLAQLCKLLEQHEPLDQSDIELKKGVDEIYELAHSVIRANCNQDEGLFLHKLDTLRLKYKPFANVHYYVNQIYSSQLNYCKTLMDGLIREAKSMVDEGSLSEATIFTRNYGRVTDYIISGDDDDKITLKLKSMNWNVAFRRLVEASSLYLMQQLDSEQLAKSRLSKENSSVIQGQLFTLDHACLVIRDAFLGLARVHERIKRMEGNIKMDHVAANQRSNLDEPTLLQLANACDIAKGVFHMSEPIERAYKLKVLVEKFPQNLLGGEFAQAKQNWRDLKLRLYSKHEARPMQPREILRTIRELQRVGFDPNLGSNDYFRDITDEVELVDMSYVSEQRCLNGFFDKFENIYSRLAQYSVHIEQYLAHYYNWQIDICQEKFAKLLEQSVESSGIESSVSPSLVATFDQLSAAFRTSNVDQTKCIDQAYFRDTESFDQIISDYLARSQRDNMHEAKEAFENIKLACRKLDDAPLDQLLDLYDRIKDAKTGVRIFVGDENSTGVKWLFRAKICSYIQFASSPSVFVNNQ